MVASLIDPRAWLHLFKLLNYYNHAHVAQRRLMTIGQGGGISPLASFAHGERIILGARVVVGENTRLWAGPSAARVVIGDDTIIGPNAVITAANYRYSDGSPISDQTMEEADIVIGADVWVGANAVVLAGVRIGEGAVIGAGAVVTRDVPDHVVVAGAPARIIAQRSSA